MNEEEYDEEISQIAKKKIIKNTNQKYRCGHCSRRFVTLGTRFQKHYYKHHKEELDKPLKAKRI